MRHGLSIWGAIVGLALGCLTASWAIADTAAFDYTGSEQTFVVPAGVSSIGTDVRGAQGGGSNGGAGGRVQTTLAVTPGQTLYLYVGGTGGTHSGTTPGSGGFNGGGVGGTGHRLDPWGTLIGADGGGGASDIRQGGNGLNNRVVVAGGGGGRACCSSGGGSGGDLTGGTGSGNGPGTGGTQTQGGTGCSGGHGIAAAPAGFGIGSSGGVDKDAGGGGGGGWYGGGGGCGAQDEPGAAGGGGGSSYANAGVTSGTSHSQGFQSGAGQIILTWTAIIDTDTDGVADGGDLCSSTPSGEAVDANGCADSQVDTDSDGTCNPGAPSGGPSGCTGTDNCPVDANKVEPGQCGCGVLDTDTDTDGVSDCNDDCPNASDPGQEDLDGDGVGDACDFDVPRVIHHQGRLLDAAGLPVEGTVSLRYRLYDAPTSGPGETTLFDETHPAVGLTRGLFSALIGSVEGGVPDSALDAEAVYLGVSINGGGELLPRTRIASTAYTVKSKFAEQLVRPGTLNAAVMVSSSGNVGIGQANPQHPIETGTGAYLSAGGAWTNASSRNLKQDIRELSAAEAIATLRGLAPVSFRYKADPSEEYLGFIAEDVPGLVAERGRNGLGTMDIVAVLTKAMQEQQARIELLEQEVRRLKSQQHHSAAPHSDAATRSHGS